MKRGRNERTDRQIRIEKRGCVSKEERGTEFIVTVK